VKSPPFEYFAPRSVDEALALLQQHGDEAKVLAGGQSLIPILALRLAHPAVLIDIGGIEALGELAVNGIATIGATVTQRRASSWQTSGRVP
jgi:carbon-monoxide dehydrogenase medium subunit